MGTNQKQKITICFHIYNNDHNPRLRRSPTMFLDKRKVVRRLQRSRTNQKSYPIENILVVCKI